jgi:DNA polymerase delta subunit 3
MNEDAPETLKSLGPGNYARLHMEHAPAPKRILVKQLLILWPSRSAAAKDFFGKGKEKTKPAAGSAPSSKEGTPAPAPPATLKKESSSIFKSFAKAKPKLKREGTDSSAAEDVSMRGMQFDDDDDEEDDYVAPVPRKKENVESDGDRKSRKEREANLRRMMDEEEDKEEVMPTPEPEEEEEETILGKDKPAKEEEPAYTVSGGRRRGKRRVIRKKTIKDEEGYLGMYFTGLMLVLSVEGTGLG